MAQDILNTELWEGINDKIADNVNKSLSQSKTYVMRFLALRGILQIAVKVQEDKGEETPESFWGERYTSAKQALAQYGFSADDRKALGQLNNVIGQIKRNGLVIADMTCEICGEMIGVLDDGQWDWVAGNIACLKCVGLYGKEASPEHVAEVRKRKGLIPIDNKRR